MDLGEIRFHSEAEGGKMGINPQICGNCRAWKSVRGNGKGRKKEEAGVVRRNFEKREKLFCFGSDC